MPPGIEIERKYLLSRKPSPETLAALGARPKRLEQVYLRQTDDWVRRIRRIEAEGEVRFVETRKRAVRVGASAAGSGPGAAATLEELEADLTADAYAALLADADPGRRPIRKVRHVIRWAGWTLELDIFEVPPGLVLLEIEQEVATDVPELPPAIEALRVREVTDEPEYTNHWLARRPAVDVAQGAARERPDRLTRAADLSHALPMPDPDDRDEPEETEDLPPTEAARDRRRDHDAGAAKRAGMRTGLAKQFKQVLDAQARRGREAEAAREVEPDDRPPSRPRVRRRPKPPP